MSVVMLIAVLLDVVPCSLVDTVYTIVLEKSETEGSSSAVLVLLPDCTVLCPIRYFHISIFSTTLHNILSHKTGIFLVTVLRSSYLVIVLHYSSSEPHFL